jgi:hypothetical protein
MKMRKEKNNKYAAQKPYLNTLIELISVLDGYRINRFADLSSIDQAIKEKKLGLKIATDWKQIRKILQKINIYACSLPSVIRLYKIRTMLVFISSLLSISCLVFILLHFLNVSFPRQLETPLFLATFIIAIPASLATQFINRKIAIEIEDHLNTLNKKSDPFRQNYQQIKAMTQDLLYLLTGTIRKINENPEKYTISLYNVDYKGIKIVKKPTRFRKYFRVIPQGNL